MATGTTLPSVEEAVDWLNANPDVYIQAVEGLNLVNLRLCDALALRPQLYLELANNAYKAAVEAGATKGVLVALKVQISKIKAGLVKLPTIAHAWMSIAQLQDVQSKAKAKSILTKASLVAPDKANREALARAIDAVARSNPAKPGRLTGGGGTQLRPECYFCCALGCMGCAGFCIACCVAGCFICN